MLPRAVESLRAQHFRNWICEVHNDDPSDEFPEAYISSLKDERFIMKNHPKNLGGTGSFNLAFDTCKEDYISILEDDNWWDSDFLSIAIQYLETEKAVNVVWSNMKLWQEDNDGNWVDTKKTTWIDKEGETIFNWPQPTQAMAALHSNGAMVFREQNAPSYKVPECVMLNAIELIRERCFEHPIVLLNKPMANFAITKHTNRSSNPIPWILTQVMLLASYVSTSEDKYEVFRNTLRYYRRKKPVPVANFFMANYYLLKDVKLYKYFNIKDWMIIAKWYLKNIGKLSAFKKSLAEQKDIHDFLIKQTQARHQQKKNNKH